MAKTRKSTAAKVRGRKASSAIASRKRATTNGRARQFLIAITGSKPLVLDLIENEAIDIHIENSATKFIKDNRPATLFRVTGHRWSGEDYFILNWGGRALELGDSVAIRFLEESQKATPPKEEEKYIEPEKQCSFCDRKASEVRELLEANFFTRICNGCVVECYQKLYGKHAT